MRKLLCVLCFTIAAPGISANASEVDLDQITYGGNGCPGTGKGIDVRKSIEPGRLIIYTPEVDVSLNTSGFDREFCAISLPYSVGPDERVVVGHPSVFGKENLSVGESLEAKAEVFIAGAQGPTAISSTVSNGNKANDFYERNSEELSGECGQSGIVRANATLLARKASERASGTAKLRGLAFTVRIESCATN